MWHDPGPTTVPGAAAGGVPAGPGRGAPPLVQPVRRRWPRPALAAAAVVAVVAAGAGALVVLRDDGPDLRWRGEAIDDPEATLVAGERALAAQVDDRHGALHEEGRCYFSLTGDDGASDIAEHLRCGPVLFVDGDPEEPYLSFPLTATGEDGDVRLEVGDRPVSPEPAALDPGERLVRPDGREAPEGGGGLRPPEPPRAAADLLGAMDIGPTTLDPPPEGAAIGSLHASFELTGLGRIDRYGAGDQARRPAEGHDLVAFTVKPGRGEDPSGVSEPTVEVEVDGERHDVRGLLDGVTPVVVSVPDDVGSVDLVVTDAGVEQRLSLLDGTPGAGNLSVLTRANREQQIDVVHQVSGTGADAGGSGPVSGTVTVNGARLEWFPTENRSRHPSGPEVAWLVVGFTYAWDNLTPPDGGFTDQVFTLELPDGRVVPAVNLAADPTVNAHIGFEVPADFTTGTLHIGGVDHQPTGLTVDLGANVYSTPIDIPAG